MSGLNNPDWDQAARTRGQPTALQVGASLGDGLMGSFDEGGLTVLADVTAPGFWAKITGRSGNLYSWTEVQQDGTGQNWITAMSPLISGGSSANTVYNAYEENGSMTVANNTIVWMRRTQGLGGEAFAFKHQPVPAASANFANSTAAITVLSAGVQEFSPATLTSGSSANIFPSTNSLASFGVFSDPANLLALGTAVGDGAFHLKLQNGTTFLAWGNLQATVPTPLTTTTNEYVAVSLSQGVGANWNAYGQFGAASGNGTFWAPQNILPAGNELYFTVTNGTDKTLTFTAMNLIVLRLV